VTRDPGLSSMFEPNRPLLDAFPETERFNVVDVRRVDADTLDSQLQANGIDDVDFVKADTQGSELFVLEGAAGALAAHAVGVEVEVEFTPLYKGQPLFADVDVFMRGLGYHLFDLRPCYWKRAAGWSAGGSYGQIVWADALYLKSVETLRAATAPLPGELRKSKILRAISVALLYGYCDFALEITASASDALTIEERSAIDHRIRIGAASASAWRSLPGRRGLAAVLRRLWRICRIPHEGWSVSDPEIGNLD
jgi:hypothetical protein